MGQTQKGGSANSATLNYQNANDLPSLPRGFTYAFTRGVDNSNVLVIKSKQTHVV